MNAVTQDLGPCPCRYYSMEKRGENWFRIDPTSSPCREVGTKLRKNGHLVGCKCRPCTGLRSQKKGQAAQAKMHKRLGGEGFTPSNEESARPYEVTVTVMPESKTGGQIPATFDRFIATDWFRRALSQSERAVPSGSGVLPAVVIRGDWCIVDIRRKGLK